MPKTRYTSPEGWAEVVEHPPGASQDDIRALARQHHTGYRYAPPDSPEQAASPAGPDIVGRAHRALTAEPPSGSRTGVSRALFGETVGGIEWPGRVVRAAGDLFLPGSVPEAAAMGATLPIGGNVLTAPLKRTGAAALAGGGAALAQGRDWASSLMEGGRLGLSQFAGEVLPGMARFGATQKSGQRALAAHEARAAHDKAMHEAVTGAEAEGYKTDVAARRTAEAARVREARARYQEQVRDVRAGHEQAKTRQATAHEAATASAKADFEASKRQYAEEGAKIIADSFKEQVSAFREFPSNEQGLLAMVYGPGPQKLSAVYDEVMKEIVIGARGRSVEILAKDASALKIRMWNVRGAKERGMPDMAMVDASQLAEKATGYWKKDHGLYRRAVAALDRLDIGDPAARAEYKAGQALIQFTDKTKMLKGEKFNPEAARAGFTELKKVDELRRRGQGDIFTGPVAEAVRRPAPELRLPAEPAPLAEPRIPAFRRGQPLAEVEPPAKRVLLPEPKLEGVESKTVPNIKWWQAAALAEIPAIVAGIATGHHSYGGYGLPLAAGAAAAGASGRRVITQAPLSPLGEFASGLKLERPLAQEARRATGPGLSISPGQGPSTSDVDRQMLERFGPKP